MQMAPHSDLYNSKLIMISEALQGELSGYPSGESYITHRHLYRGSCTHQKALDCMLHAYNRDSQVTAFVHPLKQPACTVVEDCITVIWPQCTIMWRRKFSLHKVFVFVLAIGDRKDNTCI